MLRKIVSVLAISPLALSLVATASVQAQEASETMTTSTLPACQTLPILRRNDRATQPNNNVKRLQENLNRYNFRLKQVAIL